MWSVWGTNADRQVDGAVTTTSAVRIVNERAVFDALSRVPSASASELGRVTGLSKPTVATAVSDLERIGLLEQLGRRTGNTGRAPRTYRISPHAGAVLALDVGRAWVRGAVVDLTGAVAERAEQRSRVRSGAALIDQIGELADHLVAANRAPVTYTVLGSPGVHDPAADVLRLAPNLPGWGRPGVLGRLRGRLPGVLDVENDINLAALAEHALMAAAGTPTPDFVFVSAGSGLGMGIVLGNRLLRGFRGAAGEISYFPAGNWSTPPARRAASLEQLTGPASIVAAAHRFGLDARQPEDVFAAARAGSRPARRAVSLEARRLAAAIAGVVAVLDPPLVVLGGGIGRNGDLLVAPIEQALAELLPLTPPQLRVSRLDTDAPLQGAIAAGLERARHLAFASALAAG